MCAVRVRLVHELAADHFREYVFCLAQERTSKKCAKESKEAKIKLKKAIQTGMWGNTDVLFALNSTLLHCFFVALRTKKGNREGARIYAENSIRCSNEVPPPCPHTHTHTQ